MDQAASKDDAGRDALYKVAYDEAVRPQSQCRSRACIAISHSSSYARNLERLDRLEMFFQIASGVLIVEVILWAISIAV